MNSAPLNPPARAKAIATTLAVLGLAACIIGWMIDRREFFLSYFYGIFFFLGLSLGAMALLMIHHLTAGRWGYAVRRFLEAAMANLPVLAVLFVPLFFGLVDLYPWKNPALIAASELLQKKQSYLNTPGFVLRTIVVFAVWILLAHFLLRWSAAQDETVSTEPTRKLRTLSGPGLVIYPMTFTFASVDWVMSMESDWSSTMFPILICIGQMLSALAFVILLLSLTAPATELSRLAGPETFHKLGNLLLTFTMLWAYLAFAQFLITWSGNLPREISWYLHRTAGGWRSAVLLIALFQFFLPFFLLLMRPIKQRRALLASVAVCVLLAQILEAWWTIAPSIHPQQFEISWLTVAAFCGVGGVWLRAFLWNLQGRAAVPLNDPRFALVLPVSKVK